MYVTVESVLKDYHIVHKKYGLSRQVVFGDKYISCLEMWNLLPGVCGLSRQVISQGSGLSRQVSLYKVKWSLQLRPLTPF